MTNACVKDKVQKAKSKGSAKSEGPRKIKHPLALVSLFFLCSLSFALCSSSRADDFLTSVVKDGIGIRPMGMGGSFVALADDSNAVYYNPAALVDAKSNYTRGYMDMNTDYYAMNDCWAYSLNGAGTAYWNRIDKSGDRADVTAFSFGTKGSNNIAWGLTHKNIAWKTAASGEDRGWTMDAGLLVPISKELTAGVLLQDVAKNNAPLATAVRLGVRVIPQIAKDANILIDGELRDLKSKSGATVYMHYGAEARITDNLILRGGWGRDHFTAGATAAMPNGTVDYAIIVNQDSKNTHMFGFRLGE